MMVEELWMDREVFGKKKREKGKEEKNGGKKKKTLSAFFSWFVFKGF